MAERFTLIPLLKYSPDKVLYYEKNLIEIGDPDRVLYYKKNLIEIGDPQFAYSPWKFHCYWQTKNISSLYMYR